MNERPHDAVSIAYTGAKAAVEEGANFTYAFRANSSVPGVPVVYALEAGRIRGYTPPQKVMGHRRLNSSSRFKTSRRRRLTVYNPTVYLSQAPPF